MNPTVSIIMGVYNGSRYLAPAIESMLAQSFSDFEFLIVNDTSTDDTPSILHHYALKDKRIRILSNAQNQGLTKSLNVALSEARGEYIARQDADDIAAPSRIEKQIKVLESDPSTALVSCWLYLIDEKSEITGEIIRKASSEELRWRLRFQNAIGGHSQVMFRKREIQNLGGYDESFRYSQDFDLWQRISRSHSIKIIPEHLQCWRVHSGGISTKSKAPQTECLLRIAQKGLQSSLDHQVPVEHVKMLTDFFHYDEKIGCETATDSKAVDQLLKTLISDSDPQLSTEDTAIIRYDISKQFLLKSLSSSSKTELSNKLALIRLSIKWSKKSLFLALKSLIPGNRSTVKRTILGREKDIDAIRRQAVSEGIILN